MDSREQQQQYCLKWNHHQSNLLKVFARLLGNEQFTDVLLATEGKTIRCHKVVLSACSTYFENLFLTFDEKNQIIILKDTTYDDVFALVEFMYRGEINVGQHQLASLLKTAENLKVKGLAEVTSGAESSQNGSSLGSNGSLTSSNSSTSLIPSSNNNSKVTNAMPASSSSNSSLSNPLGAGPASPKKPKVSIEPSASGSLNLALQPLALLTQRNNGTSGPHCEPLIMKRKRGRPRILDAPGEVNPFAQTRVNLPMEAKAQPSTSLDMVSSTNKIDHLHDDSSNEPTPGGPLTMERIKELGIIKMNDYLSTGTRQQFWEEYYVKVVMQAVRNKEIDMKTGAEILGVSYGTLYGRYRETFGYLKHAWNAGGRPTRPMNYGGSPSMVPSSSILDAGSLHILEQLKYGKINIRQAAELLKVEPTILAYELAAKAMTAEQPEIEDDDDHYHDMMEVQPDVVIHDDMDDDLEAEDEDDSRPEGGQASHHSHHVQPEDDEDSRQHLSVHEGGASIKNEDVDPIATN